VNNIEYGGVHSGSRNGVIWALPWLYQSIALNVSANTEFPKRKMEGLDIPGALRQDERVTRTGRRRAHYIDGYELEETILREDGDDDLMTGLSVVVKKR